MRHYLYDKAFQVYIIAMDNGTLQRKEQTFESKIFGHLNSAASGPLIQLGYNDVSWVRHDGAKYTSDVTGSESNDKLL